MQHNAADELDGVGPQAQHPVGSLPDGGESLRQQLVQGFALGQPLPKLRRLSLEGFLTEGLVLRLQCQNPIHRRLDLFQLPLGACSENLVK